MTSPNLLSLKPCPLYPSMLSCTSCPENVLCLKQYSWSCFLLKVPESLCGALCSYLSHRIFIPNVGLATGTQVSALGFHVLVIGSPWKLLQRGSKGSRLLHWLQRACCFCCWDSQLFSTLAAENYNKTHLSIFLDATTTDQLTCGWHLSDWSLCLAFHKDLILMANSLVSPCITPISEKRNTDSMSPAELIY